MTCVAGKDLQTGPECTRVPEGCSLPSYQLILRADASAAPERIEFADLAKAISYVEKLGDFIEAELWSADEYLASVHPSRTAGRIWTVGKSQMGQEKRKTAREDRLPGGT